jgi:hypothetical protein
MDLLLALLQQAGYVAIAIALARPSAGRAAAALLLVSALLGLAMGLASPAARELVTTHTFLAYEGQALEPQPVHFPTGTARAPGWQWPLPWAAFALLWAALLWRRRELPPPANAFLLPLLCAWTATAAWLGMQTLAAPAPLVQPFGLDRFLWPAGLALSLLLARTGRMLVALLSLSPAIVAARLPAALFSKYASDRALGTCLDVSSIVDVVNPMTRAQFDPRLVAGSAEQQFWLIWAEHVFVFPAFHLMSLGGVAFAALMYRKYKAAG